MRIAICHSQHPASPFNHSTSSVGHIDSVKYSVISGSSPGYDSLLQIGLSIATSPFERLSVVRADNCLSYGSQLARPSNLFQGILGRSIYSLKSMMIIGYGITHFGDHSLAMAATVGVESMLTFPSYLVYRSKMNGCTYPTAFTRLSLGKYGNGIGPFFTGNLMVTLPALTLATSLAEGVTDQWNTPVRVGLYAIIAGGLSTASRNIAIGHVSLSRMIRSPLHAAPIAFRGGIASVCRELIYGTGILVAPLLSHSAD